MGVGRAGEGGTKGTSPLLPTCHLSTILLCNYSFVVVMSANGMANASHRLTRAWQAICQLVGLNMFPTSNPYFSFCFTPVVFL